MKKLSSESSNWEIIGTINDLIDEVMALDKVITRDIVRIATDEIIEELSEDTHRTVTLRIPKGMTVGEIFEEIDNTYDWARWGGRWFGQLKDEEVKILFDEVTQKALDEVQPNE